MTVGLEDRDMVEALGEFAELPDWLAAVMAPGRVAEALRRAEQFVGERPLELWCGSRKVRSIPAATARA